MTETIEPSAGANHPNNRLSATEHLQEDFITVELPGDVIAAIQHCTEQSGQTQTETILAVLRAALGLEATQVREQRAIDLAPPHSAQSPTAPPRLSPPVSPLNIAPPAHEAFPPAQWLQEFHELKNRLAALEHLIPKIEALEGKLPAF